MSALSAPLTNSKVQRTKSRQTQTGTGTRPAYRQKNFEVATHLPYIYIGIIYGI